MSRTISIPLTKDHAIIVDEEDADLALLTWQSGGGGAGYARQRDPSGWKRVRYLHRVIADRMGLDTTRLIDHIDRDSFNCRRSNLRVADAKQNMCNRKRHKNNTSGVVGVRCHAIGKKWTVQLGRTYLGLFEDIREAQLARDTAAAELHGEFATFNKSLHPNVSQEEYETLIKIKALLRQLPTT